MVPQPEEPLKENCRHRPVQYLNNVDHRAIKRRIRASQHCRSFWGAWRTIAGYEAIHMIRKGQAYGSAPIGPPQACLLVARDPDHFFRHSFPRVMIAGDDFNG
jgi:hypothetical protein